MANDNQELKNELFLRMVYSSEYDLERVLPGVKKATKNMPNLRIIVDCASTLATSDKVHKLTIDYARSHMDVRNPEGNQKKDNEYLDNIPGEEGQSASDQKDSKTGRVHGYGKPWINGESGSNRLTWYTQTMAGNDDLVIGVPIDDPYLDGLSSILSTSEGSDLYPVLTVCRNSGFAAANIAVRYLLHNYEQVVVAEQTMLSSDMPGDESIKRVSGALKEMGIKHEIKGESEVMPDDLVMTVFNQSSYHSCRSRPGLLRGIDGVLSAGNGIQIGVREDQSSPNLERYIPCLDGTSATGIVGVAKYESAANIAGIIMRHEGALKKIEEARREESEKLRDMPRLLVQNGEVEVLKEDLPYV